MLNKDQIETSQYAFISRQELRSTSANRDIITPYIRSHIFFPTWTVAQPPAMDLLAKSTIMKIRDKGRGNSCHGLLTPVIPLRRLCRLCMESTIQSKGLRQVSRVYYSKFQQWGDLWAISLAVMGSSIWNQHTRQILLYGALMSRKPFRVNCLAQII